MSLNCPENNIFIDSRSQPVIYENNKLVPVKTAENVVNSNGISTVMVSQKLVNSGTTSNVVIPRRIQYQPINPNTIPITNSNIVYNQPINQNIVPITNSNIVYNQNTVPITNTPILTNTNVVYNQPANVPIVTNICHEDCGGSFIDETLGAKNIRPPVGSPWPMIIMFLVGMGFLLYTILVARISNSRRQFSIGVIVLWTLLWTLIFWAMWRQRYTTATWWFLLIAVSVLLFFFVVMVTLDLGAA
jgi:hypothetical protein